MEVTVYNRYSKEIIESFAISTISKSFDAEYGDYYSPQNTNNFDFISRDNTKAIEITVVFSENNQASTTAKSHKNKREPSFLDPLKYTPANVYPN